MARKIENLEEHIYGMRFNDLTGPNAYEVLHNDLSYRLYELKSVDLNMSKIKEKIISKKKCTKYLMSIGYSRNEAYGTVNTFTYRRLIKIYNKWYLIYINIWGQGGLI